MTETVKNDDVGEWLDSIDTKTFEMRDGRYLRAIGAALDESEKAQRNLESAIAGAKAAGESWQAIGVVLGTSRQAAHRKYARSS